MSTHPVPPRQLWGAVVGFGVWCSAIVVLYALHAIGCSFAWPTGALRLGLGLALLAHLVGIAWLWRGHAAAGADPAFGRTGTFLHKVVIGTLIAAFVASVLTLGPALLLSTCV